jgi:hypothetical protein
MAMDKYICTLEVKSCEYKGNDKTCLLDKPGCSFRMQEMIEISENNNQPIQKSKKWFEAYIK